MRFINLTNYDRVGNLEIVIDKEMIAYVSDTIDLVANGLQIVEISEIRWSWRRFGFIDVKYQRKEIKYKEVKYSIIHLTDGTYLSVKENVHNILSAINEKSK